MKITFAIIFFCIHSFFATAQQLFVGTNYHPHDNKDIEKIKNDIQLMKAAHFTVVRMGHLAWDSYEPSEGRFDFAWFDKVMDLMNDAGIKVILDIAIRPAPIWLHQKYPSIKTSMLIEDSDEDDLEGQLKRLGYTPEYYSPNADLVEEKLVKQVHDKGMKIIPWTVNDEKQLKKLKKMGVDGVITDYPDVIK